jgi:hypothetical protein
MSAPSFICKIPQIDLQDMIYYSAPKRRKAKERGNRTTEERRTRDFSTEQNDYQTSQLMQI